MRVSEIRVTRIRVNQGLGVLSLCIGMIVDISPSYIFTFSYLQLVYFYLRQRRSPVLKFPPTLVMEAVL